MSLSIDSINNKYYNKDYMKTVRNLQSLGVTPSGNQTHDNQNLQIAEYQKKQDTLSSSNASTLANNPVSFQNTLQGIGGVQSSNAVQGVSSSSGLNATSMVQPTQATGTNNQTQTGMAEQQVGATQLAELNKLKLGLISA